MESPSPDPRRHRPERVEAAPTEFVEFYRRRFASMVRLAVALTGSPSTAEDVVHDAFLRVHAQWHRVDHPDAYLRTAVVNGCRSVGRRARREQRALRVHGGAVTHLDADEMFDALMTLPYRQRAALVLRFYADLSEADIAEVLGCRVGTVGSLVHRGLAQLRRIVER